MVNILKKVRNIFKRPSKEMIIEVKKETIVYWTANGKNYHTDKNCFALSRSKNILEGSIVSCNKESLCELCKNIK